MKKMSGKSMSMLDGLTRKNPPEYDASMKPKGGSVDSEPTRDSVAPTPRTIGPRVA